jgi:adenylate cyclase
VGVPLVCPELAEWVKGEGEEDFAPLFSETKNDIIFRCIDAFMKHKFLKFIGLGVILALLLAFVWDRGIFMGIQRSLQNRFYDFASASSDIVIVAIDEKTLLPQNLGPLQSWKRENYAKALGILNEKGVAVVGIDITFPDVSSKGAADDQAFRDALRKYPNTVLAARYFFDEGKSMSESPNATLMEANPAVGWINVSLDEDGFIRKVPLFNAIGDRSEESFSLLVVRKALKADSIGEEVRNGQFRFSKNVVIPAITLRDPATEKEMHFMYVNYFAEPEAYTQISMSDLLAGRLIGKQGNTVDLKGKTVLIGPTAIDLQDQYLSPVSRGVKMSGVEIHANNVQTIQSGKFLRDQSAKSLWVVLMILLVVNLLLFSNLRVRFAIPILAIELLAIVISGIVGYESGVFVNVIYPILAALLAFVGTYLLRFILEQKERKFAEKAFGQYVSKDLVAQILRNPESLKLGGARRNVTVFFSDIASFTSISEKMEPEPLVRFLNTYLGAMTNIILARQGTLDKYEGDAIMAFWGAPVDMADHARNACYAALECQYKLEELRIGWIQQGLPPFRVRIGINTGDAIAGNMGSESRFDYTVMGDQVNLASRLEGTNKQYGTELIISENTYALLGDDFVCRELDLIRVKGKEKPVRIYELVGESGKVDAETLRRIQLFSQALVAYRSKNFLAAANLFKSIPNDPAAGIFNVRCENFMNLPPSENWDGVYTFTEK